MNELSRSRFNLISLMDIYKVVIMDGRFCRMRVSKFTGLEPHICEGRWYAEIRRREKFGVKRDWKTVLNMLILQYMRLPHCHGILLELVNSIQ